MSYLTESSSINRMINTITAKLASPSPVKQAPDARALNKATTLLVESLKLETPPMAQVYLEPAVNAPHRFRKGPKSNYELPTDLPKLPIDFVPTNKTPSAGGEEMAEIRVREGVPADLLDLFAKINAQQAAESKAVEEAKRVGAMDIGTEIAKQYRDSLTERGLAAKVESLMREGFSEQEAVNALQQLRFEEAVKKAREPPKPVPVATAIAEAIAGDRERPFGDIPVAEILRRAREEGTSVIARRARLPTAAADKKLREQLEEGK